MLCLSPTWKETDSSNYTCVLLCMLERGINSFTLFVIARAFVEVTNNYKSAVFLRTKAMTTMTPLIWPSWKDHELLIIPEISSWRAHHLWAMWGPILSSTTCYAYLTSRDSQLDQYTHATTCKTPPPYRSGKALAFARKHDTKKLFTPNEGQTLDLIFHETLGSSYLSLEPTPEVHYHTD